VVDPDRRAGVVGSLGPGVDSHGFVEGSLDPAAGSAVAAAAAAAEDNLLRTADLGHRRNLRPLVLRDLHLRVGHGMNRERVLYLVSVKRLIGCVTINTVRLLLGLLLVVIE
jgi:hypothetical protein